MWRDRCCSALFFLLNTSLCLRWAYFSVFFSLETVEMKIFDECFLYLFNCNFTVHKNKFLLQTDGKKKTISNYKLQYFTSIEFDATKQKLTCDNCFGLSCKATQVDNDICEMNDRLLWFFLSQLNTHAHTSCSHVAFSLLLVFCYQMTTKVKIRLFFRNYNSLRLSRFYDTQRTESTSTHERFSSHIHSDRLQSEITCTVVKIHRLYKNVNHKSYSLHFSPFYWLWLVISILSFQLDSNLV